MDFGFTTAAYVVAAVLFILSLGGLSGQESAKRAVWYGIVGMALAVMWLPSARSRGWLRVMMAKHLFQHRYDYRHEWLRFTHALAEGGKDTPDLDIRALRALSDITESSGATMLRPDESGTLVFAAQWVSGFAWVRRDLRFCDLILHPILM